MTDRELLELAAKAAGIEYDGCTDWKEPSLRIIEPKFKYWNPLTDAGDALRLAAKLHFRVEINRASIVVFWTTEDGEQSAYEYPQHTQDDDYNIIYSGYEQATRRAIVRASAEIGKGMK